MLNKLQKSRAGFTLVEIMIVVAIIALLAAIAVPNFMRARKRSQATRCLEDLRILNAAVDQYAIDYSKAAGSQFTFLDVQPYLKTGTQLYSNVIDATHCNDLFDRSYYLTGVIDRGASQGISDIVVNPDTFAALSDVAPADFWSPYGDPAIPQ